MNLRINAGYLFVTPDPDIDRTGLILHPTWLKGKPNTGLCLLHNPSSTWNEVDLTGKRIVFDRWAGRAFELKWVDGKMYNFVKVSQWAVLAVLGNDKQDG